MTLAAAAVMRASHRTTRVTVAPAAALTSLPREIHDNFSRWFFSDKNEGFRAARKNKRKNPSMNTTTETHTQDLRLFRCELSK